MGEMSTTRQISHNYFCFRTGSGKELDITMIFKTLSTEKKSPPKANPLAQNNSTANFKVLNIIHSIIIFTCFYYILIAVSYLVEIHQSKQKSLGEAWQDEI